MIESFEFPGNLEIPILDKIKLLLMSLCKPPFLNKKDFLFLLNNGCNCFCITHENITLTEDFNMIPENDKLDNLREMNKSEHLLLKPTCF